jgi:hypothetical protein
VLLDYLFQYRVIQYKLVVVALQVMDNLIQIVSEELAHLQYFQALHLRVEAEVQLKRQILTHMELHTEALVVQVGEQLIIQANLLH